MPVYKLHYSAMYIIRLQDGANIPIATSNGDYVAYLAWQAAGGTPAPADPPPPPDPNQAGDAASLDALRTTYQTMLTRLDQITAATAPTNAQVIAAVRDLAEYQARVLKFQRRLLG